MAASMLNRLGVVAVLATVVALAPAAAASAQPAATAAASTSRSAVPQHPVDDSDRTPQETPPLALLLLLVPILGAGGIAAGVTLRRVR